MGLSHTQRASLVLMGMTCTDAIILPACTDRDTPPYVGRCPSFVGRQEALAENPRDEMKRRWRTRLASVPKHLGEIARELEMGEFT